MLRTSQDNFHDGIISNVRREEHTGKVAQDLPRKVTVAQETFVVTHCGWLLSSDEEEVATTQEDECLLI